MMNKDSVILYVVGGVCFMAVVAALALNSMNKTAALKDMVVRANVDPVKAACALNESITSMCVLAVSK